MSARLPALHPADMQRGRIPVDLLPPQVDNLRCSQTMPVRCQDHSRVPVTVSVVRCRLDQLFDLSWSEVLPAFTSSIQAKSATDGAPGHSLCFNVGLLMTANQRNFLCF